MSDRRGRRIRPAPKFDVALQDRQPVLLEPLLGRSGCDAIMKTLDALTGTPNAHPILNWKRVGERQYELSVPPEQMAKELQPLAREVNIRLELRGPIIQMTSKTHYMSANPDPKQNQNAFQRTCNRAFNTLLALTAQRSIHNTIRDRVETIRGKTLTAGARVAVRQSVPAVTLHQHVNDRTRLPVFQTQAFLQQRAMLTQKATVTHRAR